LEKYFLLFKNTINLYCWFFGWT